MNGEWQPISVNKELSPGVKSKSLGTGRLFWIEKGKSFTLDYHQFANLELEAGKSFQGFTESNASSASGVKTLTLHEDGTLREVGGTSGFMVILSKQGAPALYHSMGECYYKKVQ